MEQQVVAKIRVKAPDEAERNVVLQVGETLRIGRDITCDLVISDPAASRVHATISASVSGVVIVDNQSTNGTFVNGARISMRDIQSGDIIDVGSTKLAIEVEAGKVVDSLSSSFSSRAMTAQLKPIAVTVLVGSLLQPDSSGASYTPSESVCEMWLKHSSEIITSLGGTVDKQITNHIVALWLGGNSKELAKKAINAALQVRELTGVLSQQLSVDEVRAKLIVSSGHGLKGLVGGGPQKASTQFTILGDPINTAFQLEENVHLLNEDIIVCSSTADLVKGEYPLDESNLPVTEGPPIPQSYIIR